MNNSYEMDTRDIKTNDKENKFTISFMDGTYSGVKKKFLEECNDELEAKMSKEVLYLFVWEKVMKSRNILIL